MLGEELGDDLGVAAGGGHAQRQRLERARDHPGRMRIELGSDRAAQQLDRAHMLLAAKRGAGDEVAMAADIFGQRVDDDVGAVLERLLEDRPEQRVVADDGRAMSLARANVVGDAAHEIHVDEGIQRVRRRLDQHDGDAALGERRLRGFTDRRLVDAVREADGGDAERLQRPRDQRFGAAIERLAVQDGIARPAIREERRGDRRHAAREDRRDLGALIDRQPVLDDLAVGMVEARIDEAGIDAVFRLAAAGGEVEEVAPLLGRTEDEGRGQEDRRLYRPFGERRVVAVTQHHRLGVEDMVADAVPPIARRFHGSALPR